MIISSLKNDYTSTLNIINVYLSSYLTIKIIDFKGLPSITRTTTDQIVA